MALKKYTKDERRTTNDKIGHRFNSTGPAKIRMRAESDKVFLEDQHPFITKLGRIFPFRIDTRNGRLFLRILKNSWKTMLKK